MSTCNVIITKYKDLSVFVAQGIEHDICCQDKDLDTLKETFDLTYLLNIGDDVPPVPEYIIEYLKKKYPDYTTWVYNSDDFETKIENIEWYLNESHND